jgi:L-iditol 2-dehydrogenase
MVEHVSRSTHLLEYSAAADATAMAPPKPTGSHRHLLVCLTGLRNRAVCISLIMRAAYLLAPGKIQVRETPEPVAQAGEVVIRVERALTCGTDLKAYRRGHPFIAMPGPFGHQYAGVVSSVADDVRGFEPGTPVWGVQSAPCDRCPHCARGHYSLCPTLQKDLAFGAFAQFMRLPRRVVEHNLLVRPRGMPAQRAAFLEPVSCVIHGLERIDWRGVERVLVVGLGSMGLLFCQLLPRFSRAAIAAAGRNPLRLVIARGYGLERVMDVEQRTLEAQLAAEEGFDCVIECTGQMAGWQSALRVVRPGGQVLFFGGLPKGTTFEIDSFQLHYQELSLLGSFHFGPPDVRRAAELLEQGEVMVDDLISGELGLEQLEFGLRQMEAGKGIKYAIDPWA